MSNTVGRVTTVSAVRTGGRVGPARKRTRPGTGSGTPLAGSSDNVTVHSPA